MRVPAVVAVSLAVVIGLAAAALAGDVAAPIQLVPDDVKLVDGPPSLAKGARFAVLEGDPKAAGIVTMRLAMPKGFAIAPHTHTADERVTVLSGTVKITIDGKTKVFPAGSFYVTPKGTKHAVAVDDAAVIQITVQGPWTLDYVDAKDDPRKKP
jgi:quercetin dioxygenase-like cupin family protein